MRLSKINQQGAVPLLVLVAIVAVISFLGIAYYAPLGSSLLSTLFPKDSSQASVSNGIVELSVLPAQKNVSPSSTFTVDIMVDTRTASASAAQIQLNFDPQYLQATQITNGGFMPQDLVPGMVSSGQASITVGASPGSPVGGIGKVATVNFTSLSTQTPSTQITLDQVNTQVAVIGESGDQAGVLHPSTISIGQSSPSATLAPSPSVNPADITAPKVSITAPANGAIVKRNSNFLISVNATDNIKVSKVEFYINGSLKGTDSSLPFSLTTKISGKAGASHTIMVKAYDAAGNSNSSSVSVKSR